LVENRDFSCPLAFNDPVRAGPHQSIALLFGIEKLEWSGYPMVKKV